MKTCRNPGCRRLVPEAADVQVFRDYDLISDGDDAEKLLAWSLGCCRSACCVQLGAAILLGHKEEGAQVIELSPYLGSRQ